MSDTFGTRLAACSLIVYLGVMFQLFDIAVYLVMVVAGRDVWKAANA